MFKVLFAYPNDPMLNPPPVSIGIFTALLKEIGVDVSIFDTTFYADSPQCDQAKAANMQVKPFAYDEDAVPYAYTDPADDFAQMVQECKPDLICVSVLEATWPMGSKLIDAIPDPSIPVSVGGVFATFSPEIVFMNPRVNNVVIGEGERPMIEMCKRLMDNQPISDIENIWFREESGTIKRNPVRPVIDLDTLPIPDYSCFHSSRFLRPMAGTVYRAIPIETNRGCPFSCTFCNSPTTAELYKSTGAGKFFRKKSLDRIETEIHTLVERHNGNYCYFLSDTFLAMTDAEFDRFIDIYKQINLPFWIQSRAETVTQYRAEKLKEVGCHRISMGLEHGNEAFRHKMLKKKYKNDRMIKAGKILANADIPLSLNNIIGFPDETRELIFDTIELNRQIPFDTANAYSYVPFRGTPLYEYCVQKGYVDKLTRFGSPALARPLDMPQLSANEIEGLRRTFVLYTRMPKEYWGKIRIAEQNTEEGNETFERLKEICTEQNF